MPLSYLADRLPARRFLSWVVGLWSVSTAALGVASLGWLFSLGRVGVGLFESPNFPVVTKLSGHAPHRRSGTALGINGIGTGLGLLLGGPLSGLLLATWGWRGMFLGEAALGFLLIGVWRWTASRVPISPEPRGTDPPDFGMRWDGQTIRRVAALPVAVFGAVFIAFWAIAWFPLFLKTTFGISTVSSFYLVLPGLGAALGALGGGLITDRAWHRSTGRYSLLRWWGGALLLLAGFAMTAAL